jgi:hypothetical protein
MPSVVRKSSKIQTVLLGGEVSEWYHNSGTNLASLNPRSPVILDPFRYWFEGRPSTGS